MSLDFSKPFYVCTTLRTDPSDSDSLDDEHFFKTYEEGKAKYQNLEKDGKKYMWFAEIGFHTLRSGRLTADWMYFRTNKKAVWDELRVENSLREFRGHGIPEASNWSYVDHYKVISSFEKP